MLGASRNGSRTTFAAGLALACVLAASCVPHSDVRPPVSGPDPADIIAEQEVSVAAQDGVVFSVRGAELTVPAGSLEFDALVRMALAEPAGLPPNVALPDGRKVLAIVWIYTDVRVAGRWPLEFQILSDFQDPDPYDPDMQVHCLNAKTGALEPIQGATISRTYVSADVLPGYTVVTVPIATPQAIGLTGSQAVGHIAFPSTVMSQVDSAFGMRPTGTDLQRLTNSLAPGFRDRPYLSANGYRVAIVRESLSGAVPDRIFGTTPSNPLEHLTQVATAEAGTKIGDLCFRPDGDSVVVAGHLSGGGTYGGGVFRVPLVGAAKPELIYRDPGPGLPQSVAISPDGAWLAVTTARFFPGAPGSANYDVIVLPTAGPLEPTDAEVIRLTAALHAGAAEPAAEVEAVSISPDGGTVHFGAYVEGQWRVYAATIDGSAVWEMEALRGYRWPALSPDASQMIVGRNDRLYLYAIVTGQMEPLGPPANGYGAGLLSRGTTKISWRGR